MKNVVILLLLLTAPLFAGAAESYSVLKPLVTRCDLIDDEIVGKATGHEARLAALRCMAGKIGPIEYVHHDMKEKLKGGTIDSSFGKTISPDRVVGGPKVPPMKGKYDTERPDDFDRQMKRWIAATKTGDAIACAEIGAAAFLDAHDGKYSLTEQRMYKCFSLAAEAGVAEAKFMTAVCLYYGIGVTRSKPKARAMLRDWKVASGTTKANRGGWVARRFAEMPKEPPRK